MVRKFAKPTVPTLCHVNEVIVGCNYQFSVMDDAKEQSFAGDRHHEDAVKLEFMITAALVDLRQSSDDISVNKHNASIRRAIEKLNNKLEVQGIHVTNSLLYSS